MNHYPHHIGDFAASTRYLSRLERDIYRDMRDLYFLKEAPLDGRDPELMARRLACVTQEEVAAMYFVLSEMFVRGDDGYWRREECDRIIANYKESQEGVQVEKSNAAVRKERSRKRRAAIFSALREHGVVPEGTATIRELLAVCREHGVVVPKDEGVTPPVTANDVTCHGQGTGNQNQNHNHINTPQPPSGGAGAGMAIALQLAGHFPQHRRTKLDRVAQRITELAGQGVTAKTLLDAAAAQAQTLAHDGGKACPDVLGWLRNSRWLDTPAMTNAPAADWHQSRSGIEAMGKRMGMQPFEESGMRLLSDYRAEVERRMADQEQPA
jgi:uncharacterized protein YdaU (DUF1376 family)